MKIGTAAVAKEPARYGRGSNFREPPLLRWESSLRGLKGFA